MGEPVADGTVLMPMLRVEVDEIPPGDEEEDAEGDADGEAETETETETEETADEEDLVAATVSSEEDSHVEEVSVLEMEVVELSSSSSSSSSSGSGVAVGSLSSSLVEVADVLSLSARGVEVVQEDVELGSSMSMLVKVELQSAELIVLDVLELKRAAEDEEEPAVVVVVVVVGLAELVMVVVVVVCTMELVLPGMSSRWVSLSSLGTKGPVPAAVLR